MDEFEKRKEQKIRGDTFLFILADAKRFISNLEVELVIKAASLEEKDFVERSKELAEVEKKVKNVAIKVTEMLAYSYSGKSKQSKKDMKILLMLKLLSFS